MLSLSRNGRLLKAIEEIAFVFLQDFLHTRRFSQLQTEDSQLKGKTERNIALCLVTRYENVCKALLEILDVAISHSF